MRQFHDLKEKGKNRKTGKKSS